MLGGMRLGRTTARFACVTAVLALIVTGMTATPASAAGPKAESGIQTNVDQGFTYLVNGDEIVDDVETAIVTGCDGSCPAALTIPQTLGGHTVTWIGENAFDSEDLTSVVIPDTVTMIQDWSFNGNFMLANVHFPTSLRAVGGWAFSHTGLTSLSLPSGTLAVGDDAFWNSQIASAELPDSLLEVGADAFTGNELTSVDLPANLVTLGSGGVLLEFDHRS